MKRYLIMTGVCAAACLLFFNCATNLKAVPIKSISYVLRDIAGRDALDRIVPGRTYILQAVVINQQDLKLDRVDYTSFKCGSPNATFKDFRVTEDQLLGTASGDSFAIYHDNKNFMLSINVIGNAYAETVLTYHVDWDHYTELPLRGENGMNGKDGRSAKDAINAACLAGNACVGCLYIFSDKPQPETEPIDGIAGGDGENGGDAGNLTLRYLSRSDILTRVIPVVEGGDMAAGQIRRNPWQRPAKGCIIRTLCKAI